MCGIVGLLRRGGGDKDRLTDCVSRMTASLVHRGPDAEGIWTNAAAGIALGHRRLSVLELSAAGSQPMQTPSGRFVVTFNGEIYNHLDIRKELEAGGAAPNWRGHSDTETLLHAIERWGVAAALQRLIGMFAFALWDEKERALVLCRDRFGEKPLYYGWSGRDLVFASELKALANHPDWSPTLDREALTAFMRYAYVPAPNTIWAGIRKLPPASFVVIAADTEPGSLPTPTPYWSFREHVVAGQNEQINDEVEAARELERLLSAAIKRQCLSDVPLGAFLSGGIDSSTIVSLMQAQASQPVRTFTIGFEDQAFDEAGDAQAIAAHLGTAHTELYVDPGAALDIVPRLPQMYDEPFADSSQIPTHLVAALARKHVTVALSGDAGDELFAGYNRHIWGNDLNQSFGRMPTASRRLVRMLLGAISPDFAGRMARAIQPLLPSRFNIRHAGDQLTKLARIVESTSPDAMHRLLCSIDNEPTATVLGGRESGSWCSAEMEEVQTALGPLDRMTLGDSLGYLTDDILQKVDRAAMAVSLETRVPFLDRDVVEFAARIPASMKVRKGRGKWLVRQVLYKHVPQNLVDRPKSGFAVPLDEWLRGPLKSWCCDLLSQDRLQRQGLFNCDLVEMRMHEHMNRVRNHGHWLWNLLMAQAWHDRWCPSA